MASGTSQKASQLRTIVERASKSQVSISHTKLSSFLATPMPCFWDGRQTLAVVLGMLFAVTALTVGLHGTNIAAAMKFLVLLGTTSSMGACLFLAYGRRMALAKHKVRVAGALEELAMTHEQITSFVTEFDKRTRRYFHCVTLTKVSSYCALLQMSSALNAKLDEAEALFDNYSVANAVAVTELLHGSLAFKDGILRETGNFYIAPISALPAIVDQVCDFLNAELIAVEREIELDNARLAPKMIELHPAAPSKGSPEMPTIQ